MKYGSEEHSKALYQFRYRVTSAIAKVFESERSHQSPTIGFDVVWNKLRDDDEIVRDAISIQDVYQHTGLELLFYCLLRVLAKNNMWVKPTIEVETCAAIEGARVFVGTHTGLAPLSRFAASEQWDVLHLSSFPRDILIAQKLTGVEGIKQSVIPADRTSLLNIARLSKKDDARILLTADHRYKNTQYKLISPAIFKLADKLKIPLHYQSYTVTAEGNLRLSITGPHFGNYETLYNEFVAHQQKIRPFVRYQLADFDYKTSRAHAVANNLPQN